MKHRTFGEWAGLLVAVLAAGAVVTFVVMVVGSFVGLPIWAAIGLSAFGVALIVYPVFRPAVSPPSSPAPSPAPAADREDPK